MILHGYCEKQGKEVDIEVTDINASAGEDLQKKIINARIRCKYVRETDLCDGKNCSVLLQNGYIN